MINIENESAIISLERLKELEACHKESKNLIKSIVRRERDLQVIVMARDSYDYRRSSGGSGISFKKLEVNNPDVSAEVKKLVLEANQQNNARFAELETFVRNLKTAYRNITFFQRVQLLFSPDSFKEMLKK